MLLVIYFKEETNVAFNCHRESRLNASPDLTCVWPGHFSA